MPPKPTAAAGRSSRASPSSWSSASRREGSAHASGSSHDSPGTINPFESRRKPPQSGDSTGLRFQGPAPSSAEWQSSHRTQSGILMTKPEMFGMSALKEKALAMQTIMERQSRPLFRANISMVTMEHLILIIETKIKLAQRSPDNETTVEVLNKQITELRNWVQQKREWMIEAQNRGREIWEELDTLVLKMIERILSWEFCQKPDDMRDYLIKEKIKLNEQSKEAVEIPQVIDDVERRIKELRVRMAQLLPTDFETGWATFKVEAARLEEQIGDLDMKKRDAQRTILQWQAADKHWTALQQRYRQMSHAPPTLPGVLNDPPSRMHTTSMQFGVNPS